MAIVQWPLSIGCPVIGIELPLLGGSKTLRRLIADTGAGSALSVFQLILDEQDCVTCAGIPIGHVRLGGAYSGSFPLYLVNVGIAALNFAEPIPVVGVSKAPAGFDGIAGFRFLNRFHYGNHAGPDSFGLEAFPGS